MLSLCNRRRIKLQTAFGVVFFLASVSFLVMFRMLKPLPLEMRMSVSDGIQTWDNLAHLVEIGSFSRNLASKVRNISVYDNELSVSENLTDFLLAANSSSSKISLLNSSAFFWQGETIAFRIDIFNGYHLPHVVGGDDVRVWLTDQANRKSAVCSLIDLKNGSYIARFKALFNGTLDVHASIVYPGEYLQIMMSLSARHYSGFVSALFEKLGHKEVTLCAPFHTLPNYTRVCNFTQDNNNMSWYCGSPYNTNLSCSDWTSIRPLTLPAALPLSKTDQEFISKLHRPPALKIIPTNLKVNIMQKENQSKDLPPCNERTRPFLQSWTEQSPRGWIQNSEWMPSTCKLINLPTPKLSHCLSNSTILLIGDSDQLGIFEAIRNITKCEEDTKMYWPHTSSCRNQEWNLKMEITPHEYPLDVQSKTWIHKDIFSSSAANLDSISSTGKYIILLHHYLSLSPYHPSIYEERIHKTRDAVDRLLERNPNAFVAIRGPYTALKSKSGQFTFGDNFVKYYTSILVKEYKKLWKDVLFIDGWDISVAIENMNLNLPHFAHFDIARHLLMYACF